MGRIVVPVVITNVADPTKKIQCNALVDTGASHMVLPTAWREQLGDLDGVRTAEFETATQNVTQGAVCGPVRLQIEGFPPIYTEVVFVEMSPKEGEYEPLLGYIVLEQSQAAVDMLGHRLVHVERLDLKRIA